MKKTNNTKQASNSKFDAAFDKYANMLGNDYKQQFKKVEYSDTKGQKVKDSLRKGNQVIVDKGTSNKNSKGVNIAKALDTENEIQVKTVPKEMANQVQQARLKKEITQDKLATAINEKASSIKNLEAGVGTYEHSVVAKIEKYCGVKFDRSSLKK